MNFLSPASIAIAAGLTVPPLVAMYFLKLKRQSKPVSSTLLWRKAVEDLRVNAPFQKLRSSLLLLLQLLVLILGAIALGKPMFQTVETHEDSLILLVDRSASMGVLEEGGKTRLDIAKTQAKRAVENMGDDARAMVIAFCDRATVISSFDTNKEALARKINSIEPTQSTSNLGEALSLAEAYTQNMIIGRENEPDVEIRSNAPPASVVLFTDGRIQDADKVSLQKFDVSKIRVTLIGKRSDNIGMVAMDARRHYERPQFLEVTATVRNFGPDEVTVDAVVYVDEKLLDVQTITLAPGLATETTQQGRGAKGSSKGNSTRVVSFDEIEFEGEGVVEVVLRTKDALPADDRAWTIVPSPARTRVLIVAEPNPFFDPLAGALAESSVEITRMRPDEYESIPIEEIADGERSRFDVVVFDRHSTKRLPQGNYMFWGSVPEIDGVKSVGTIDDEVIFHWDETHPILRHVSVEAMFVFEWLRLELPKESVTLIDGATSPVMSYLARDASQYLIIAFGLMTEDRGSYVLNTYWIANPDFVVFMHNAVQYLAAAIATTGKKSIKPGEPVTLSLPRRTTLVTVHRPDGTDDGNLPAANQTLHYGSTRNVGTYRVEPGVSGHDTFAVNLFSTEESLVAPAATLSLGTDVVTTQAGSVAVNEPAWPYFVLAMLALLLVEWIVYNRRVFV